MTGVRSTLGSTLVSGEQDTPAIVLSYGAWRNWFGADSNVIGRTVPIRGSTFRVVGVGQEGFEGFFKKPRDFWIPLGAMPRADATRSALTMPDEPLSLLVRLAPGVSASQGSAFFASTLHNMTASLPDSSRVLRVFLTLRATAIA